MPLGLALGGHRWSSVIATAALLSFSVEALQLSQIGRHAGPSDLCSNLAGALLGRRISHLRMRWFQIEAGSLSLNRGLLIVLTSLATAVPLLALSMPGSLHQFSNWDPSYKLAIGDELTLDRSWRGSLHAWAIYDRPFQPEQLQGRSRDLNGNAEAPIAAWQNPTPHQPSGFLEMSPETSAQVHESLVATGMMSLWAKIQVNDLEQVDLERIITYSRDSLNRNFTLGQEGDAIAFRLRTPSTGPNAYPSHVRTSSVLEPGQVYEVLATYDGHVSQVFVNGVLLGRLNLAARAAAFPALHDLNLPLVLSLCAGSLAALLITLCRPGNRAIHYLLGCAAGLFIIAAIPLLGASPVWPFQSVNPFWQLAPALSGGWAVALSMALGQFPTKGSSWASSASD